MQLKHLLNQNEIQSFLILRSADILNRINDIQIKLWATFQSNQIFTQKPVKCKANNNIIIISETEENN